MNTAVYELIETAAFVVDAEGQKKAVMLDFSIWEELLELLEDIEDSAEIESVRANDEKPVSWTHAKDDLAEKRERKNLRIYQIAREYLLSFDGISEEILDAHLTEWRSRKPSNMRGLFRAMLMHAQNRQAMPNSIGDIDRLSDFLFDFDPHQVSAYYRSWEELFDSIEQSTYRPPGPLKKENKRSLWVTYCKAILSCAEFLSRFNDLRAFDTYVEQFYADEKSRLALAEQLSQEVYGFGFALACDFLKGVGYPEFIKTDVHINEIARGVGITTSDCETEIFQDIISYCRSIGKLPFEVDKLFWLVGSGKFYLYDKRIPSSKEEFIRRVRYELPRLTEGVKG